MRERASLSSDYGSCSGENPLSSHACAWDAQIVLRQPGEEWEYYLIVMPPFQGLPLERESDGALQYLSISSSALALAVLGAVPCSKFLKDCPNKLKRRAEAFLLGAEQEQVGISLSDSSSTTGTVSTSSEDKTKQRVY